MHELLSPREVEFEEIVLVNDISDSMNSCDWEPSRLSGAKRASRAFLDSRSKWFPGDRIGIVGFSDEAELVLPLVPAANRVLIAQKIDGMRATGTTSVGAGLRVAEALLLGARSGAGKRIILYSDGDENTDPRALPFAERLKRNGTTIFTIGIGGSPDGVNENLLQQIASVLEGKPAYRFIADADAMVSQYHELGETRLVRWAGS